MTLLFLLLFGQALQEVNTIPIESKGSFFDYIRNCYIQADGTFTIPAAHSIYHVSQTGQIIRKIGGKGDGPGEFQLSYYAFWDGSSYMVMDNRRRDLSYFSADGTFQKREPFTLQRFHKTENATLMVDFQKIGQEEPSICPVEVSSDFSIKPAGEYFHQIDPIVKKFGYNFSQVFVTDNHGLIFVMDQLNSDVHVYNEDYKKVRSFKAQLKGFVQASESWPEDAKMPEVRRVMVGISVVQRLCSIDAGLVIGYFVPNPADFENRFLRLSVVDEQGKALTDEPLHVEGHFVGTYDNQIYTLKETDDLNYEIKVYRFGEGL